jgi:hypothetical protein
LRCRTPRLKDPKGGEEWPAFSEKNGRRWMYLKGGSHIKPISERKRRECRMWRDVRDVEYQAYGKPSIFSCRFLSSVAPSALASQRTPALLVVLLLAFLQRTADL